MEPVKIVIVEDDILVRKHLFLELSQMGYEVIGETDSGEEALLMIQEKQPDLIIMDIKLEGKLSGIETSKILNAFQSIPTLFLTSLNDPKTAIAARASNPYHSHFLAKPFSTESLESAIGFLLAAPEMERKTLDQEIPDTLFLKRKNTFEKVSINDILWIEGGGNSIIFHTIQQKKYVYHLTFPAFLEQYSHPKLLRVHRSYMVNVDKVDSIFGRQLVINQNKIPYSDTYASSVTKHFKTLKTRIK